MSYTHFSKTERHELSILLKKGYSLREIADTLERSPSSVSREVKRNSVKGEYVASKAQHKAYKRRKYAQYQGMKIREDPDLESYVKKKLKDRWSPEQIAGRLKFQNNGKQVISFRSIYNYIDTVWGQDCKEYLAYRGKRKPGPKSTGKDHVIKNRVFIEKRPQSADKRKRLGDFEGDLLGTPQDSKHTLAATVDRKSRYFKAAKIKTSKKAVPAFKELLDAESVCTLTLDNGRENASYKEIGVNTFFCHPYSAWEKPTIENTFQRLRKFIPKKASLEDYTDKQISAIVDTMNNTPRKCLGWKTPKEVHFQKTVPKEVPI